MVSLSFPGVSILIPTIPFFLTVVFSFCVRLKRPHRQSWFLGYHAICCSHRKAWYPCPHTVSWFTTREVIGYAINNDACVFGRAISFGLGSYLNILKSWHRVKPWMDWSRTSKKLFSSWPWMMFQSSTKPKWSPYETQGTNSATNASWMRPITFQSQPRYLPQPIHRPEATGSSPRRGWQCPGQTH